MHLKQIILGNSNYTQLNIRFNLLKTSQFENDASKILQELEIILFYHRVLIKALQDISHES